MSRKEIIKKLLKKSNDYTINKNIKSVDTLRLYFIEKFFYKIPKNFIEWNSMIDIFIYSYIEYYKLYHHTDCFLNLSKIFSDIKTAKEVNYISGVYSWISSQSPIFIVTKDLIDILLNVDISIDETYFDNLFLFIDSIFDNILFLFPENIIYYYSENASIEDIKYNKKFGFIDHCFVCRRKTLLQPESFKNIDIVSKDVEERGIKVNDDKYINDDKYQKESLSLSTLTLNGVPLNNTILINKNSEKNIDIIQNSERVKVFNMTKIIVQCLMLIVSKPDLIITTKKDCNTSERIPLNSKGFGTIKTEKVFYPRVLNLDYVEKTVRSDDKNGKAGRGSQSPKRPHWRLGYTVDKPIGKMKGVPKEQWERKRITVKPYLVRGNAEASDND